MVHNDLVDVVLEGGPADGRSLSVKKGATRIVVADITPMKEASLEEPPGSWDIVEAAYVKSKKGVFKYESITKTKGG